VTLDNNSITLLVGESDLDVRAVSSKQGDRIVVQGHMSGSQVYTTYPEYPSPETLDVDVSFNGLDGSNDHIKFSYVDPFVLGVKPRLISPKGTCKLLVEGYGMANTGDDSKQQIAFKHYPDNHLINAAGKPA
jgi:hypothetical protein